MAKVIGVEVVNYVSKKTNKEVSGYRVHLTTPIDPATGCGDMVESCFLNSVAAQPMLAVCPVIDDLIGQDVRVIYNRYGRVDELMII